jgi:nucleoside 2-deoxyribosyltransferase
MNKKTKPICYLSGSIRNTSIQERLQWRDCVQQQYSSEFSFLDPTRQPSATLENGKKIIAQDKQDIAESDAVLVHLLKYSAGTMMELHLAFSLGKLVVIVAPLEFHDDIWLREHCHFHACCHFNFSKRTFLSLRQICHLN